TPTKTSGMPSGSVVPVEIGIGAGHVTGVQTCALPIYGPNIVTIAPLRFGFDPAVLSFVSCMSKVAGKNADAASPSAGVVSIVMRSEERRVGKECRIEWSLDVAKKEQDGSTAVTCQRAE